MKKNNYQKNDQGFQCVILGQSMKPFFSSGDILYVEKRPFDKLHIGNSISFKLKNNERSVIHRIINISSLNGVTVCETQGDNLTNTDGYIYEEQIEGVVSGRFVHGKFKKIFRSEEQVALKFTPILRLVRGFVRKSLAVCMKVLYPFIHIKRVSFIKNNRKEIALMWRGKKIASSRLSGENRWVHPWFRKTPILKRLGL